jgi:hypothetical protein
MKDEINYRCVYENVFEEDEKNAYYANFTATEAGQGRQIYELRNLVHILEFLRLLLLHFFQYQKHVKLTIFD